jgi:serine/threonine protein kinase/WD40 repeat protein
MTTNESISGADPRNIDRLLALGLDNETDELALYASFGQLIEKPGGYIGRYKLLRTLGEGGMGIVYLAKQTEPVQREVALKVIKPGMDSKQVLARFEAERQALALMEHPHVARVYDAGLAPSGRPYFVMEYVKGLAITEHCDSYRLTIEERLQLFLHVCEGVQHAHQKGIIHRDLKPSNILVVMQDQETIPKVIDFGVARAISQLLTERTIYTEQGQLVGTPEYMSPEQARADNQDIDTRADVYSLGMLLYELLTGVLPFEHKTFHEGGIDHIRKVICEDDPKTPSTRLSKTSVEESAKSARLRQTNTRTLQHKLRGDLDWITLKALEKDRSRRYATINAMAADIRNYLNHKPVSAAPPAFLYRTQKFVRRRQKTVGAAGAGLLILALALWAVQLYLQAGKEREHGMALEHERILTQADDLVTQGRLSDANEIITQLLSSAHVGRQAQLLRAKILLNQQNVKMAVSWLEGLLDTPDEVAGQAHMLLASIYYEGDPRTPGRMDQYYKRHEYHRQQAETLIAGTADYYFLRAQGTYEIQEMLRLLDNALKLDSQHYDSLYQRACIYYAQKGYERLLMDAHAMTVVRPNGPQGYNLKAIALREMSRFAEAIQAHDQAIRLSPDQAQFYHERGRTYARMHQYEMALDDTQKCVDLEPSNSSYAHRLFGAYTALGRYDQAEQFYQTHPHWMAGYRSTGAAPAMVFFALSFKLVLDSLGTGCVWHGETAPPQRDPFAFMYLADEFYAQLSSKARRLIHHGSDPSWHPDGKKLLYTQGISLGSALAVLDLDTGRTELLVAPGRDPEWSPDGRYIAFVKAQRLLPLNRMGALNVRDMLTVPGAPQQPLEVWVLDLGTREVRRVAEGEHPHWGCKSGLLYYSKDQTLYAVSPNQSSDPDAVLSECFGDNPVVSPNEQYVADVRYPELRIVELETKRPVASWIIPPQTHSLWTTSLNWSQDSRTVSVGNGIIGETGLWIYDLDTRNASRILKAHVAAVPRSPDDKRLAISVSGPLYEIWIADVDPNRPVAGALGTPKTVEEHCREIIESCNRWLEADPESLNAHLQRTMAALWIDHNQAALFLQEIEHALERVSYPAGECNIRARGILSHLSPAHSQLLPLAVLLAREAVKKDAAQGRLLAWTFHRSGYPEKASEILKACPDALRGSSRYDSNADTYTITGAGADIWDTVDDFHFAYKRLQGDGSITARIDMIENTNEWTKAGVMIRSTLQPDCVNAMLLMTPSGRLSFQHRRQEIGITYGIYTSSNSIQLPHWVRLIRRKNHFTAQHSEDGIIWQDVLDVSDQPVTIEIPMDETAYIGLAVTSHDATKAAEANISNIYIAGSVSPTGPFDNSQDICFDISHLLDDANKDK